MDLPPEAAALGEDAAGETSRLARLARSLLHDPEASGQCAEGNAHGSQAKWHVEPAVVARILDKVLFARFSHGDPFKG